MSIVLKNIMKPENCHECKAAGICQVVKCNGSRSECQIESVDEVVKKIRMFKDLSIETCKVKNLNTIIDSTVECTVNIISALCGCDDEGSELGKDGG